MAETLPVPIVGLSSADLSGTALRRDHMAPPEARDATYLENYDRTTLWYDAFWRDGEVIVIAPLMKNLAAPVKAAGFQLDGRKVPWRRRRFQRHEVWRMPSPEPPGELRVAGPDWSVASPVSQTAADLFAGRNVILTISKDNELAWIRDFARFYRETQGTEAILFIDNGSQSYGPEDVAATLSESGLQAMVVSAPLPYGAKVTGARNTHRAKFFRPAMLNLARLRFLYRARAVLNIDIDELVWSEGASVFDLAAAHPIGFAPFRGRWRAPGPDAGSPPLHRDHVWISDDQRVCPIKYAVAPNRLAGRISWDVHRLERLPFKNRLVRKDAGYWHCSGVSTGWKQTRRLDLRGGGRIDTDMQRLLDRTLST